MRGLDQTPSARQKSLTLLRGVREYTRHSFQGCAPGARTIPGGGGYEEGPRPWVLSLVHDSCLESRIADGAA
jgi:hypothetical protein